MTRILPLVLLALAAFGLAACTHPLLGEAPVDSTPIPVSVAGAATAQTPPPFDAQFIESATIHNQKAIALAQSALTHAQHEELRVFAYEMVADHEAEIRQMTAWRKTWYPNLPPL